MISMTQKQVGTLTYHVRSSSPSPFRWGLGSKEDLVWLIGGPLVGKCSL